MIKTFGTVIKPMITKGKGMWNPLNNQLLENSIYCIRDKDVNCFLMKTGDHYIAIDSGYLNSQNIRDGLKSLSIDPLLVSKVFLTHLDIDHAGGVSDASDIVFPNAEIYLSDEEEKYLSGEYIRKTIAGHRCKLPIKLTRYSVFHDLDEFDLPGARIKAILAPGHSLGHTAFVLNEKYLFSGDCIIANQEGGFLFYDFWNQDAALNKRSAHKLKDISTHGIESVITSHSGMLKAEDAFKHINESPNWRERGFLFCADADIDPYK